MSKKEYILLAFDVFSDDDTENDFITDDVQDFLAYQANQIMNQSAGLDPETDNELLGRLEELKAKEKELEQLKKTLSSILK